MLMSCLKAIRSLELVHSLTLLTKLDGYSHRSHLCPGVVGQVVNVEVEVVDANLDYNILLG